ncbi:MAG: D-2-hydroxyacid dehydrogenase [Eubacteriales bacterium]|nr:D-2-hydroxyacid dehydrogenase [Eubacteriales bacterium]
MKIIVLDGYTLNPGDLSWSNFESLGDFKAYPRSSPSEVLERISDADIILNNKCRIDAEVLSQANKLKYIGMLSTGYDVLDLAAIKQRGIVATNIPEYGSAAVAQMTFALLLEITNQVALHSASVHRGEWTQAKDFCYQLAPLTELQGLSIGLVGFGKIARAVAKIALAFGLKVIATKSTQAVDEELSAQVDFAELDTVLGADIVSLHCPLSPETEYIINRRTIGKMKDGAILLNTARGKLVDSKALAEAIKSAKIRAAGLDVTEQEPIPADNPLLGLENCFITPHIAWAAKESRARLMEMAFENLQAFLEGSPIRQL